MNEKEELIRTYLQNRREDEYYTSPEELAGYWLYHADVVALTEFNRMINELSLQKDQLYINARNLITEAINNS